MPLSIDNISLDGNITGTTLFFETVSASTVSATTMVVNNVTYNQPIATTANTFTTGTTVVGDTIYFNRNDILSAYSATVSVSGNSNTFTGGTVTGPTNFTNGLTANTISATTYISNGSLISPIISGTTYSGVTNTFFDIMSATTPTTGATVYMSNIGNRKLLAQKSSLGTTVTYQPAIFNSKVAFWNPPGNAATLPGVFGMAALTATGTVTARNVATTSLATRTKRLAVVSANPAGSVCGYRNTVAQYTVGSGTAGVGGFMLVTRFIFSDGLTACRGFVGMRSSTAAPTDVEPTTLTNCIGVGCGIADTNLKIVYGGSVAQTAISLGANFPAKNATAVYELALYAPSTSNNTVHYQVTRLDTGDVAYGTLTGTAGTALPASTTLLTNNDYRGNGGLAGTVSIDFISIYLESDN